MSSQLLFKLKCFAALALSLSTPTAAFNLGYTPGAAPFPEWNVISSSKVGNNISQLSLSGIDISSWYTIGSHGTLMATLLDNHVFNDADLFYSTNLEKIDYAQFQVPSYYRSEFSLDATGYDSKNYILKTNGITSRAEIWLNGQLVADNKTQAGAYGGHEYDISKKLNPGSAENVLLVKVFPTNYNRDFALGFVDWNP